MKEATGELNMTVVTLIAVAALGAVFYLVVWPLIQRMLIQQTCNTYGDGWLAVRNPRDENLTDSNADVVDWKCCPKGQDGTASWSDPKCIVTKTRTNSNGN